MYYNFQGYHIHMLEIVHAHCNNNSDFCFVETRFLQIDY